jgi:hypothetical protein
MIEQDSFAIVTLLIARYPLFLLFPPVKVVKIKGPRHMIGAVTCSGRQLLKHVRLAKLQVIVPIAVISGSG